MADSTPACNGTFCFGHWHDWSCVLGRPASDLRDTLERELQEYRARSALPKPRPATFRGPDVHFFWRDEIASWSRLWDRYIADVARLNLETRDAVLAVLFFRECLNVSPRLLDWTIRVARARGWRGGEFGPQRVG